MSLESLFFDSSKRTIEQVVQMVQEHPHLFDEIVALALKEKPQVSNRASRVISETSQKNPEMIRPWLPLLIEKLQNIKTDGVKMNVLKIFTFQPYPLNDEHLSKLVSLCFEYIYSGLEKPAVKAYSLDILFKAARQEPGLTPELVARINSRLPEESASFNTRGKKIIHRLHRK
ncbi:MAG: hypothetical protein PHD25_05060 [Bacteroidales bacterium]|nr:hypothetical protein [Bacteroidales bacterium]